jgi:hypothetical protein
MKKVLGPALILLALSAGLIATVPAWESTFAQEGSPAKRSNAKTIDDVRKLEQNDANLVGKVLSDSSEPFFRASRGEIVEADPFDQAGVPSPLPTMDMARKNVNRLRELMKSGDEASRAKAKDRADDILTTYFLADMKSRVAELDAIKKRVAEMEAQLEKRMKAKTEIIDLQKKVLETEADGLGFFGPESAIDPYGRANSPNLPSFGTPVDLPRIPSLNDDTGGRR